MSLADSAMASCRDPTSPMPHQTIPMNAERPDMVIKVPLFSQGPSCPRRTDSTPPSAQDRIDLSDVFGYVATGFPPNGR